MAKISFDQINTSNDSNSNFSVGFFGLKNDGDEAVVRIMHDDTSSFELITTHPIQLGNKYRRVNCIRDPRDPMDNCPLCKSGTKVQQRFYIHLIQYVKDDNGNIIPQAKIWERSASYAVTIKNLIDEYGPLSDCIFKIRRNGEAGSMNTTYSILYGNPQVYRPEFYPKDTSLFENYSVVGSAVMDKNFEELSEFIATGEFPQRSNNSDNSTFVTGTTISGVSSTPDYNPSATQYNPNIPSTPTNVPQPYTSTPVRDIMVDPNTHFVNNPSVTNGYPVNGVSPNYNGGTTSAPQRPVRYY